MSPVCSICGAVAQRISAAGSPLVIRHALVCPEYQPPECPECHVVAMRLRGPDAGQAGPGPYVLWHATGCSQPAPVDQLAARLAPYAGSALGVLGPECPTCREPVQEVEMVPAWNVVSEGRLVVLPNGGIEEDVVLGGAEYGDFQGTEWIECTAWWTDQHDDRPRAWGGWVEWALHTLAATIGRAPRPPDGYADDV